MSDVRYTPETQGLTDQPPDLAAMRIGGVELPVAHFTLSFDSQPCQSWSRPDLGAREIKGQITALWTKDTGWRPNTLVMSRWVMFMIARRFMPKRKWRRWRGKLLAQIRADRIAAEAATKRPDLHPGWWERRANEALSDLPVGADYGEIGSEVAKAAPGWEFVDATAIGDTHPRVALSMYDPGSPL